VGQNGVSHMTPEPSKNLPEPSIHPVAPVTDVEGNGWMEDFSDSTTSKAAEDLVGDILAAHRVPHTRRPINGVLEGAQAAARRLLDAGVAAVDIQQYVTSRGSLAGRDITVPGAVLTARLKEMPIITGSDSESGTEVAKTKLCRGPNCWQGRQICVSDVCTDVCNGAHAPRGAAKSCPDCH
jgi:hypothetical protein